MKIQSPTMTYTFDSNAVLSSLRELDDTRRLAFGVCMFERALPEFLQFQIDTGCMGGGQLRAALAQCWSALETRGLVGISLTTVAACERFMPDSETHASAYASAAIDAISIACNLLSYLGQGELHLLVEAAEFRRDTFDLFIQNSTDLVASDARFEQKIIAHPLMQEELRFLHDDIAFLQGVQGRGQVVFVATLERVMQLDYRRLRLRL